MIKKLAFTIFAFLSFPLFFTTTHAFTNNFNVTADEELITVSVKPGNTYNLEINLNTMNSTQMVYLFGLSLPSDSSYSATTWISPVITPISLNNQTTTKAYYTLTIPSDISAGEYYQALAVGDKTFSDSESSDPTTFLAIPLTVQVSSSATESVTTTSGSSNSSSTSNISQSQNTEQSLQSPTSTTAKKLFPKKSPQKTTPDTDKLFSKINILDFFAKYSILKQETIFTINIKNDGNIYSIPTGTIQVQNLSKDVIKNLPINQKQSLVKPKSKHTYTTTFGKSRHLIGFFKANLKIISQDNQTSNPQEQNQAITFVYIGLVPLILIVLVVYSYLNHKKKYHKLLLIICMTILVILIKTSQQPTPKFLSQTQELSISAELKPQIGLKAVINNDLSKTILFTNTNTQGASLYSLQNGTRTHLDSVEQYTFGSYSINLTYPQDSFPIMMLPTGH